MLQILNLSGFFVQMLVEVINGLLLKESLLFVSPNLVIHLGYMLLVRLLFLPGSEKGLLGIIIILEHVPLFILHVFEVLSFLLAYFMLVLDNTFELVDLILTAIDHVLDLVDLLFHIPDGSALQLSLLCEITALVIEALNHLSLGHHAASRVICLLHLAPLQYPIGVFNFEELLPLGTVGGLSVLVLMDLGLELLGIHFFFLLRHNL
jgi:hypothetical protein